MPNAIEVASLYATLDLRDNLSGQLGGVQQRLSGIGGGMMAAGAGLDQVTGPLRAIGMEGLQAASGFEDIMTQLEIFGGLGPAELQAVSAAALQMGADTAFSASDAAGAMLELAKSGFSVEESMQATRAALDLAAVGGIDVTNAAGIMSTALAAFNIPVEEAGDVATIFARAASASRADVADLAQGIENVGPVAHQFGLSLSETAAALAVFSNNGIQGAEAGTQLRSMLLNMSRTTADTQGAWNRLGLSMYDANGDVRDLNTIIVELDSALDQLPVEEQNELMMDLGGSYGIVGLSALRASGGIQGMQDAMREAPEASDLASAAMNTFSGRVDSLKGSVETLMITALTPFMENVLTPLADKAIEVVNAITDWVNANPELVASLMPIIAGALVLAPALMGVGLAMTLLAPLVGVVTTAFAILTSPLVLALGALAALVLISGNAEYILKKLGEAGGLVADGLGAFLSGDIEKGLIYFSMAIDKVDDALGSLLKGLADQALIGLENIFHIDLPNVDEGLAGWQTAIDSIGVMFDILKGNVEKKLMEIWYTVQPVLQPIADFFTVTIPEAIQAFIDAATGLWAQVSGAFSELKAGIEGALAPVLELIEGIGRALGLLPGQTAAASAAAAAGVATMSGVDAVAAAAAALAGSNAQGRRQSGGSIPRTGMYELHQGEDVLNRQEARMLRRGGMGGGQTTVYAYGENPYDLINKIDRARRNRGR